MDLLFETVREREGFPGRTRRKRVEKRVRTGYNSSTTLTRRLDNTWRDNCGRVVIEIVFPWRGSILPFCRADRGGKRVKTIYSLKNVG
ncbi:hypothetical protein [Butyricimonas synergistica]|uniref:hypothetical protein n=1 Tax=Butyricimonas synergistica TaxID=544644 RepID=UPI0003628EE3|nr:hypothetical protein [Butyricimonas synergistica]